MPNDITVSVRDTKDGAHRFGPFVDNLDKAAKLVEILDYTVINDPGEFTVPQMKIAIKARREGGLVYALQITDEGQVRIWLWDGPSWTELNVLTGEPLGESL